jgi:hypothetical protein
MPYVEKEVNTQDQKNQVLPLCNCKIRLLEDLALPWTEALRQEIQVQCIRSEYQGGVYVRMDPAIAMNVLADQLNNGSMIKDAAIIPPGQVGQLTGIKFTTNTPQVLPDLVVLFCGRVGILASANGGINWNTTSFYAEIKLIQQVMEGQNIYRVEIAIFQLDPARRSQDLVAYMNNLALWSAGDVRVKDFLRLLAPTQPSGIIPS